ncbi:MAG TPA: hypothetical protein VJX67_24175 [Blastocatellia bacterium]|nr:hypothetical protein [Blastocatellia bacterium]
MTTIMYRFLFLAVVLLGVILPARATVIVVARRGDTIIVLSDSAFTSVDTRTGAMASTLTCKVDRAGDAYIACAGTIEPQSKGVAIFNARQICLKACQLGGTLKEKADRCAQFTYTALASVAPALDPDQPALEIAIAGVEDGQPKVYVRQWNLKTSGAVRFLVPTNKDMDRPGVSDLWLGGIVDLIQPYVDQNRAVTLSALEKDPKVMARTLAEVEWHAHKDLISPPFVILTLTPSGVTGEGGEKECLGLIPDDMKYQRPAHSEVHLKVTDAEQSELMTLHMRLRTAMAAHLAGKMSSAEVDAAGLSYVSGIDKVFKPQGYGYTNWLWSVAGRYATGTTVYPDGSVDRLVW